ncbi:MAG TPA: cysteine desulfurase [Candidatus Avanaerovorax faecigallinarum]|nr:cysteine desulfurase [Candidatus Avanaerovorax faecigallinarum]
MLAYFDNSATTRQLDSVTEVMVEMMKECWGNPSSLYTAGFEAEKMVKAARKTVADSFGADPSEIIFTSGGTEGDNTAILETARARRREGKHIITSKVEHPAVLESCRRLEEDGYEVTYIGVDKDCRIDPEEIGKAIREDTVLITVMAVNNETGAVTDLKAVNAVRKAAEKKYGKTITFHTDAVQGYGKVTLAGCGADLISVSGHKIHGPKGVGALYVKKGTKLPPFVLGGGQERGMRSGTENTPGIAGFARAVEEMEKNREKSLTKMAELKRIVTEGITAGLDDVRINSPTNGAPSVLNVSFLGTRGEVLLHTLEQDGISVSTGSACSSNKKGQSHVLRAMGLSDKEIEGAVRISFSPLNTVEEADYLIEKLTAAVKRFRKLGSFR